MKSLSTHEDRIAASYLMLAIAALVFAFCFGVFVFWLVLSEPKTKLYEADNKVCVQGPLYGQCWDRK